MKYLCLAYYDEKKFDALSKTELDAIVSQCPPYDEALRKSGHLVAQASLGPHWRPPPCGPGTERFR